MSDGFVPGIHSPENSSGVLCETNLHLIFGVTLMVVMGVATISPAFPVIIRGLGVTEREVGLLISCFTLPGVLFAPVIGIMADRVGRKKILVAALFLFGAAGGGCAFAGDFRLMLVLRFLQGLGATSMGTLNVTILGDLYTGKKRTAVLGYNIGILSLGTALYPALGGGLAMLGWRYPFLLPLVAIPLGVLVMIHLKNPEPGGGVSFASYIGRVAGSLGKKQALGLFALGVVSFFILYGSYMTYFPILLDGTFNVSSFTIGLIMSTTSFSTALSSAFVGRFVRGVPEKRLLVFGFSLYAVSMFLFPLVTSLRGFIVPTVIFGAGMGLTIPCIQSLLVDMAPLGHRAAFLSVNSLMLRLGQTLGPVLMGSVFLTGGTDTVFLVGALLAVLMVGVLWFTVGR